MPRANRSAEKIAKELKLPPGPGSRNQRKNRAEFPAQHLAERFARHLARYLAERPARHLARYPGRPPKLQPNRSSPAALPQPPTPSLPSAV